MKLYIIVLKNILKANRIYKLNYFATVFYPILFIVLRVSIWKALYTYGDVQTIDDINLQNMIAPPHVTHGRSRLPGTSP